MLYSVLEAPSLKFSFSPLKQIIQNYGFFVLFCNAAEAEFEAKGLHQAIDHSHERGVSLVRVSPLASAVQQRRVHGHFTRLSLSFRFKSMSEEKWTAG